MKISQFTGPLLLLLCMAGLAWAGTRTVGGNSGTGHEYFPASRMDDTGCAVSTGDQPVASGPKSTIIICGDDDGDLIEGSFQIPVGWDAGTLTFTANVIQTAAGTDDIAFSFAAQCIGHSDAVAAWASPPTGEVDLVLIFATANDMTTGTSGPVTPAGTTCEPGDIIYWIGMIDATLTDTSNMATAHITGVDVRFTEDKSAI